MNKAHYVKTVSMLRKSSVARIGGNAVAVLISNVIIKGSTFVVYALVARHLGADDFGRLSLALSLLYLFHIFAVAGVKTITAREVARDQTLTSAYLVNGTLLVAVASMLSYLGMVIFVRLMAYPPETVTIIGLLFIALMPYALSQVCEALFQAWEKMHLIAWANVPVRLVQTIVIYRLLIGGSDVVGIAIVLAASYWFLLLVEWGLLLYIYPEKFRTTSQGSAMGQNFSGELHRGMRPLLHVDLSFTRALARSAVTFLGIEGTIAIKTSLDLIVLSLFTSERELGLFSAALQVKVPLALIINNVVYSVFPLMCRKYDTGSQNLRWMGERLIELLLMVILPAVVGIVILAEETLLLLYRDPDFTDATLLLQIVVWFALANALTTVFGQILWASRREKRSFQVVLINTGVKLVTSLLFASQWGLNGVLLAYGLTSLINLAQHIVLVQKFMAGLDIVRSLWKPTIATLCMAVLLLGTSEFTYWVRIVTAGSLYLFVLAILIIWSSGGPQQFRLKVQLIWTQ